MGEAVENGKRAVRPSPSPRVSKIVRIPEGFMDSPQRPHLQLTSVLACWELLWLPPCPLYKSKSTWLGYALPAVGSMIWTPTPLHFSEMGVGDCWEERGKIQIKGDVGGLSPCLSATGGCLPHRVCQERPMRRWAPVFLFATCPKYVRVEVQMCYFRQPPSQG